MKTIYPLLFALLMLQAQSQNYVPLPMDSAWWQVTYSGTWASGGTCFCSYAYQYQTAGDTLIAARKYTKIIHNGPSSCACGGDFHITGCIRQDTAARKIYFIATDSTNEKLLYDFTQVKGDTLNSCMANWLGAGYCPSPYLIDSVDAIVLGGKSRKRIRLSGGCFAGPPLFIIEGVGSTAGLLEPLFAFEAGPQMDCMGYKNQAIYPDSTAACQEMGIGQFADDFGYYLAPNPSSGIFSISTDWEINEVKIFDTMGSICYSSLTPGKKNFSVDLRNRAAGIYFVRLRSGNQVSTRKLILEK